MNCCGRSFADFGIVKPKLPALRPVYQYRQLLKERRAGGDPQKQRVYAWERAIQPLLADSLIRDPQAYVDLVWSRYATAFKPLYADPPTVHIASPAQVRMMDQRRQGAFARAYRHWMVLRRDGFDRSTILHETAHLLAPGYSHGALFLDAYLKLLMGELPCFDFQRAADMAVDVYGLDIGPVAVQRRPKLSSAG